MQRFLTCCPKPVFSSSALLKEARKVVRKATLSVLLYTVYLIHHQMVVSVDLEDKNATQYQSIDYTIAEDAIEEFDDIYTAYRRVCEDLNSVDIFIRFVLLLFD